MNILSRRKCLMVALAMFFFAASILALPYPGVYAQPEHIIRGSRDNPPKKKQEEKKEEKKEEEKKDTSKSKETKSSQGKQSGQYNYHHYRDKRYDYHYKFWVPDYQRVVDIYFHEAYAQLNEDYFYDEKEGIEYLPGEWFDIILNFECFAVVNGEDIKIRYTVFSEDGEELRFGKVFQPIFNGYNDKKIIRAFPGSYLDTYRKLYIDITLTIEGNDAFGGFWLETVPPGNQGPLRVGEVIVSDTYYGAESDPKHNLLEGNTYKLWAEYEVDEYIADSATVEWRLYDSGGRDIAGEKLYIQPSPGYSVFSTTFDVPDLHFAGTRECYLDVSILASPYIGRRIVEINVTGDEIIAPYTGGVTGGGYLPPTKGSTPWSVTFVMADVLPLGTAEPGKQLNAGDDLYGMFEYVISGLQRESEERLKWSLYGPGGLVQSGEEKASVNNGTQHRYIKLPLGSDAAGGDYSLNVEIWIDNLYTRGAQDSFYLNAAPGMVKVEMEGADENFFEFTGFKLSLPYEWDITRDENGLIFVTGNQVVGIMKFVSNAPGRPSRGGTDEDLVAAYEETQGVKLTSVKDTINGHEIYSTSYLQAGETGTEMVNLYSYFIVDRSEDTFDFWVTKMSAKPGMLIDLYDDYKEFKKGLFFPG